MVKRMRYSRYYKKGCDTMALRGVSGHKETRKDKYGNVRGYKKKCIKVKNEKG
jgi:hypothetical protein